MPRKHRTNPGGVVYHVLNRATGRATIFAKPGDYEAFEKVLGLAVQRFGMRVLAYCVMSNHWHLVLWPRRDGDLSRFMQWLTLTHVRRWHAHRESSGSGPVYQGRFKSFPVQSDGHFTTVARYVERNALRAKLVTRAQDWRFGSLWRRGQAEGCAWLTPMERWPVEVPKDWEGFVNEAQTEKELEAVRQSIRRGRPLGDERWVRRTAGRLGLESSLRDPWRPSKKKAAAKGPRKGT